MQKEDIYKLLEERGIAYEKLEHNPVYTIEEMEREGITDRGGIIKNLFLRDAKGKKHYLVLVPDNKRVNLKSLAKIINSTRLSFASEERLQKYLKLEKGSVSPFGILNDTDNCVEVFIDEELRDSRPVGVHPNENTATVWLSLVDLENIITGHGNSLQYIKIAEG